MTTLEGVIVPFTGNTRRKIIWITTGLVAANFIFGVGDNLLTKTILSDSVTIKIILGIILGLIAYWVQSQKGL